jgi:flagellar basal-body rod modification protein FlgD
MTNASTAQTSAANLNSMGSAVALMGHTIQLKQASISAPSTGQTASIQVQATTGSVLAIQDSTGKTVRTLGLDGTDANGNNILDTNGMGTTTWDGKDDNGVAVKSGTYTLSVQDSASGKATGYAYTVGAVTGVGQDDKGATLETNSGTYHLTDLVQVGSSATNSSNSTAATEAISLIGHTVKLRDPSATLSDSSDASWKFTAAGGAKGRILDSSGNLVASFTPSVGSDGTGSYTWNGLTNSGSTAPAGTYTLQLLSADGTTTAGAAYKEQAIDGTGFDSTGQPLLMSGGKAWSLSTLFTVS